MRPSDDAFPDSPASAEAARERLASAQAEYERLAARGLDLDITRGKPSAAQLDLSNALLTAVDGDSFRSASGVDTRNYGGGTGLEELREIFAPLLSAPVSQLLALGNSSLTLMKDALTFALLHGRPDSALPWTAEAARTRRPPRILCPVPGYDRHFAVAEALGFELVPVDSDAEGPVMSQVEEIAGSDPSVKAIWLVPVHANPTGVTISQERTRELMAFAAAAADFTVMWDNAYALHHLREPHPEPIDVLRIAKEAGNPDRPFVFASTSKITFAGGGVAFFAASQRITEWFLAHTGESSIGPDKVNHLRHARFFRDADGVKAHMRRHAELIGPKFAAVDEVFSREFGPEDLAAWTNPRGGYFITLAVPPGTASRIVKLAGEAGVALTPAGSTHPYGLDPDDAIIRIAPTMPPLEDVRTAAEVVAACVRLAVLEAEVTGA